MEGKGNGCDFSKITAWEFSMWTNAELPDSWIGWGQYVALFVLNGEKPQGSIAFPLSGSVCPGFFTSFFNLYSFRLEMH
jgi:hypothetical protein